MLERDLLLWQHLYTKHKTTETVVDWSKVIPLPAQYIHSYDQLTEPVENEVCSLLILFVQRHLLQVHNILSKVAILRLNGGLGTTMGCSGPKSLLPVRRCGERTYSFLDVVLLQIEASSDGFHSRHSLSRHKGATMAFPSLYFL